MSEKMVSRPNVKMVRDGQGRRWICDAQVSGGDLRGQGCVLADEWIYDRNFGG
jgi:hypothetical protein